MLVVGNLVHVPFAIMSPGPTMNTLGKVPGEANGSTLISVEGLPTYETEGELSFTTVSVLGGPGFPVDAFDVLWAWIDPSQDVLPVDQLFDPNASRSGSPRRTRSRWRARRRRRPPLRCARWASQ